MLFTSKKDLWISIIIWGISIMGIVVSLLKGDTIALLVMLLFAMILLWFWFKTDYKITEDKIKIRYGPIRQTVQIQDIKLIIRAKTPLTSPALSLDRIQITCGKFDVVAISPMHQQTFIEKLMELNENISVDDRLLESK
ncbi:membrane protein YdbS with pleckstrin-like domain [Virgibacillus halotolerans]|uniref:PH domain-containing protein n=1 Tax=Virgibacillus halotolerans TaxID=1071053 RepID=UPI00195FE7F7|nr:PH domain-containing protein [Virgibacillus halotolerans]MBM7598422.1 membrane protein YdbS with pleckstrin-like domain [Virgibacillus halotolerans]